MKHLVLGSSGQVGKYLVDKIKQSGHDVATWDIVEDSFRHDLTVKSSVETYLKPVMEECDFVHFLAFDVGGSVYLSKYQNTYQFIDNNVKLMNNVFDLLYRLNKPFLFASSQMSNMFNSTYGRLKAVGESYTNTIGGLNVRFWNVYGYENDPEKTHVITDFIRMAKNNGKILMRTDGSETRNFLYAEDAAEMLLNCSKYPFNNDSKKLLFRMNEIFGAVPICSSDLNTRTILSVANLVKDAVDHNVEIYVSTNKDLIQPVTNNIPNLMEWELDFLLNGKEFTSLKDGIAKIVEKESES